ncbi:MAG: hypothetical protein JF614_18575 [Acidobacteria bacterium]|nr:hypothetical protein [Acidobacteriota bacterium]
MKRIDRKRWETLLKVQEIAQGPTKDLEIAAAQLADAVKRSKPSKAIDWDLAFAGKTALHTLFSHVDGLAYAMRSIAVEMAEELGVQIPDQERLDLQARRAVKDGRTDQAPLSPVESLKTAFQYFPALFGVEPKLDLSAEHGKAFLSLADIRDEIAHPKTLEHLSGKDLQSFWIPGYSWYLSQITDLLSLCARQIPDVALPNQKHELPDYEHPERAESSSNEPASLRTLEQVKQAFDVLMADTSSRAMGHSTSMAEKDGLLGLHGQFGIRNLLRTLFAEVEGMIAITSVFVSASAERSESAMPDLDAGNLEGRGDLDQKLVEVVNFWLRELGYQEQKKIGGKRWERFRQAVKYRDRLTYPKSPKDLRVSLDEMDVILRAQDWVRDTSDLLYVDPEKWVTRSPADASTGRNSESDGSAQAHEPPATLKEKV